MELKELNGKVRTRFVWFRM